MRITGGRYRGRIAQCPPGIIRPAMDRMRESMFSILGNISGLTFLDMFAGSGIMSLEALSRDADSATLVEKDRSKYPVLKHNMDIARHDYPGNDIKIIMTSVQRFLGQDRDHFDLVFIDPPFTMPDKAALVEQAAKAGLPAQGGLLIIHHPVNDNMPQSIGHLTTSDQRKYGQSLLSFFSAND